MRNKIKKLLLIIFILSMSGCSDCQSTKPVCKEDDKCKILINKNTFCEGKYDTYCPCRTVENGDFKFSERGCALVSGATAIKEINYLLDNGYCIEKGVLNE